jgi:hypothetical protein
MNPVERARQALAGAGIPVYRPGEAVGPCRQAYLVVFDGGLAPRTRATAERIVGVIAFVPLGRQAELEPLIREAAQKLAGIGLKPRGSAGPEAIDEGFKAHAQTMEFGALCAL